MSEIRNIRLWNISLWLVLAFFLVGNLGCKVREADSVDSTLAENSDLVQSDEGGEKIVQLKSIKGATFAKKEDDSQKFSVASNGQSVTFSGLTRQRIEVEIPSRGNTIKVQKPDGSSKGTWVTLIIYFTKAKEGVLPSATVNELEWLSEDLKAYAGKYEYVPSAAE